MLGINNNTCSSVKMLKLQFPDKKDLLTLTETDLTTVLKNTFHHNSQVEWYMILIISCFYLFTVYREQNIG